MLQLHCARQATTPRANWDELQRQLPLQHQHQHQHQYQRRQLCQRLQPCHQLSPPASAAQLCRDYSRAASLTPAPPRTMPQQPRRAVAPPQTGPQKASTLCARPPHSHRGRALSMCRVQAWAVAGAGCIGGVGGGERPVSHARRRCGIVCATRPNGEMGGTGTRHLVPAPISWAGSTTAQKQCHSRGHLHHWRCVPGLAAWCYCQSSQQVPTTGIENATHVSWCEQQVS